MTPGGEAVITWQNRTGRIEATFRPPNGPFTEPKAISPRDTRGYGLGIGADGTAVVAWERGPLDATQIEAVIRPPGGEFGAPVVLSQLGASPVVAVNAGGASVVAWEDVGIRDDPARAAIAPSGGGFGAGETIPRSARSNDGLAVQMADDGTVVVLVNGRRFHQVVKASVRPPGGSFPEAEPITREGEKGNFAELGVDAAGRFRAVWSHSNPTSIAAAKLPPGGAWTARQLISGRRSDGLLDFDVNGPGEALAIWTKSGRQFRLQSSYLHPGVGWGAPESVSPPLGDRTVPVPAVAISKSGGAIAAWGGPRSQVDRGVFVSNRRR